ncbi:FAD-dependent thymidylate synthase [Candidatus Dependentiae bacterium]|nr:MAG: FAD-dependent thymidylate synthase [Candidatus Dependentiae bacterium]
MSDIIPTIQNGYTIPVLDHGFVRYIDHMGTDTRIVEAARISYRSPSKGADQDQKLLEYLWKNKHTSPFEMCKLTLNIKMPIFVMRQYVRHRMQNLNEVSARYTQLPAEFYLPTVWRVQDTKNKQGSVTVEQPPEWHQRQAQRLMKLCDDAYAIYEAMLADGVAREMARMVLPVNIYTEIYACWDLKNLMHFITLRDDGHAQSEIQEYGRAIKSICRELFPGVVKAYEKYQWKLVEQ